MANVGFVGLGVMGSRIAKRLLDADHAVVGYNRTAAKADWLVHEGLRLLASPREVAAVSDVVFSMVTSADALHAVTGGADGIIAGLRPGTVYADMTTVQSKVSQDLAAAVAETGAHMLDTPVVGSVPTFEHNLPLTVMVGGDTGAYQQLRPVLDTINTKVFHIGGNGQALRLKAAINLTLPIHLAAFAEGVLIAEKGGIPRELALEVMTSTSVSSPAFNTRAPFFSELPADPFFEVDLMQKDLEIAMGLGREGGVPMTLTAAANQLLNACRGMGMAKEDFAAIYHALARMSGMDR